MKSLLTFGRDFNGVHYFLPDSVLGRRVSQRDGEIERKEGRKDPVLIRTRVKKGTSTTEYSSLTHMEQRSGVETGVRVT